MDLEKLNWLKFDPRALSQDETEDILKALDKLQQFKDYTHERLTALGVPIDPPGIHGECRIGNRMDWLVNEMVSLKQKYVIAEAGRREAGRQDMFREIHGERTRTYHFTDSKVKVNHVRRLFESDDGYHHLETADGKKWIIDNTWEAIEIEQW